MSISLSNQRTLFFLIALIIVVGVSPRTARAAWVMDDTGSLIYHQETVLGESTDGVAELEILSTDEAKAQAEMQKLTQQIMGSEGQGSRPGASPALEAKPFMTKDSVNATKIKELRIRPNVERGDDQGEDVGDATLFDGLGDPPEDEMGKVELELKLKDGGRGTATQGKFEMTKDGKKIEIVPSTSGTALEMRKDKLRMKLPYAVSIDPDTQEIQVDSPVGKLPVRVMPDEARTLAQQKHKLELSDVSAEVVPEVDNGKLTYTYTGKQQKKLFGLFSVTVDKTVKVSAEDGSVEEQKSDTFYGRMVDFFGN